MPDQLPGVLKHAYGQDVAIHAYSKGTTVLQLSSFNSIIIVHFNVMKTLNFYFPINLCKIVHQEHA